MDFKETIQALNHKITLAQALTYKTQLTKLSSKIDGSLGASNVIPISETFNLNAINEILAQSETVALRAYFGMDASNKVRLMLVGVNAAGEDIIGSLGMVVDNPAIEENGARNP